MWEKMRLASNSPFPRLFQLFTTQSQLLTILKEKVFENIVGKGENAGNQHFLLFPQCFLIIPNKSHFLSHLSSVVCTCSEFGVGLKLIGKELNLT